MLACYHAIIPRLCPEMPARQREALVFGVKAPLVYTNVLLRNWRAFEKLGVSHLLHAQRLLRADVPGLPGDARNLSPVASPPEPILLHMVRVPCAPGRPRRDQHRAGRDELLQTTFETFERRTRDLLARALAAADSTPPPTSWASRSIAGRTGMRTSVTR